MTTKRTPKFHVFQDVSGQWRWHLAGANGLIVCQGEGHPVKAKAVRAAEGVKRLAAEAIVVIGEPGSPDGKPATKKAQKQPDAKPMTKKVLRPAGKPMTKRAAPAPDAKPATKRAVMSPYGKPIKK